MPANERLAFSGHETFPFRYAWLRKAVQEIGFDRGVFAREDAMVRFGVGKNMVGSIRHWALVAGILEEDPDVHNNRGRILRVTSLGARLFGDDGWDPYLEDPATLWLLHWRIATNRERATTWAWTFGNLPRPEFSRTDLQSWLVTLAESSGGNRASETTIARDVDCFIRTYVPTKVTRTIGVEDSVECPLVELNLLREYGSRGHYVMSRGAQKSLPDGVFAFALVTYFRALGHEAGTAPIDNIAFAPGSPGRVFCLSEEALLERLSRVARLTDGALAFDETAGLRQVLIRHLPSGEEILGRHFAGWHRTARDRVAGGRR